MKKGTLEITLKSGVYNVHYENMDGYHLFTSDDVIGLFVGSSDYYKAFKDLPSAIELLINENQSSKGQQHGGTIRI